MTKIIDNFNYIYEIIDKINDELMKKWKIKSKEDVYNYEYFIQIMKRTKDLDKNSQDKSKVILNLYCTGIDWIKKREELIKLVCDKYKPARAYIRLQPKNKEKIIYKLISTSSQLLYEKKYNWWNKRISAKSLLNTVYWKYGNDLDIYIVDIDFIQWSEDRKKEELLKEILKLYKDTLPKEKILYWILKTFNGYHIISSWFNLHMFDNNIKEIQKNDLIEDISVKKNNPTLLYWVL